MTKTTTGGCGCASLAMKVQMTKINAGALAETVIIMCSRRPQQQGLCCGYPQTKSQPIFNKAVVLNITGDPVEDTNKRAVLATTNILVALVATVMTVLTMADMTVKFIWFPWGWDKHSTPRNMITKTTK